MQHESDILELGVASTETLGQGNYPTDEVNGQFITGLTDD